MGRITPEVLRDYLHDALPEAESAQVERALREDPKLLAMLRKVIAEYDSGEHSLGAIWRRERVSCPTRDQLGGYLLEALDPEYLDYIRFHLEVIGCPVCQANLDDLRSASGQK